VDPTRLRLRFGTDGSSDPIPPPTLPGVTIFPGETGTELRLGFETPYASADFCGWWGLSGARDFAAYMDRRPDEDA
jgi:hypothetical protein